MRCFILFFALSLAASSIAQEAAIRIDQRGDADGAVTLYLPGFATLGSSLEELAEQVDPTRSNLFVTYAGFGDVPAVDTAWYPRVRDALFAYLDALPADRFDLVGHSMGGSLAVEAAARFPERVGAVVLLDALACMRCLMMPGAPAEAFAYESPQTAMMLAMTSEQVETGNAQMAISMTADSSRQRQLASWMNAADRETFVYGYVDLLRLDLRPLLSDVVAPVTMLASPSFGRETVEQNMREQYARAGDFTLDIAPDGTLHYVMWDAPVWTAARVRAALEVNTAPRG